MSVRARFIHAQPQHMVSGLLDSSFAQCRSAAVVVGFITPDGAEAIGLSSSSHASKLSRLVIGAGTYRAFEAVDQVIAAGANSSDVRVHLGHCRRSSGKKHPFLRYHPMLHSKIYYFDMPDGSAAAFVGSHNLTGFALNGLNGEAGTLLEGSSDDPVFGEVRQHIDAAYAQAVPYDASMKEAYAWWTREYFDGLSAEANDAPRDSESKRTIVILAAHEGGPPPAVGDNIYFELPEALKEIRSLDTDVHLHLFSALPTSPRDALAQVRGDVACLICQTQGMELGRGGLELDADWSIANTRHPQLVRTVRPFRPATSRGMQQVRVKVSGPLALDFEYLFDGGRGVWSPLLDSETAVRDERANITWSRVAGLTEREAAGSDERRFALLEASPESGSFILFSRRRRRRAARD